MSSSNHDTGVVNGGGEFTLKDESLKASFHQLSDGKSEDVIEFTFRFF